jgi:hypothetical protein
MPKRRHLPLPKQNKGEIMVQQMMPMDVQGTQETIRSNKRNLKHVGVLKEDNSSLVILFKTVPNEPESCLVMGPKFLNNTYHDALMKSLESNEGQASFDFGTYLARQIFPDGVQMLAYLHQENFIKKMFTKDVVVTFGGTAEGRINLAELNKMIAEEKGISLQQLSVLETDEKITEVKKSSKKKKPTKTNDDEKSTT